MPCPAREGCKKKSFARGPGRACVLEGRPTTQRCQRQPLKGQRFGSASEKFSHSWLLVQLCGAYKTFRGGGWDRGVETGTDSRDLSSLPVSVGCFSSLPVSVSPLVQAEVFPVERQCTDDAGYQA